jgi:hypothetical protein
MPDPGAESVGDFFLSSNGKGLGELWAEPEL